MKPVKVERWRYDEDRRAMRGDNYTWWYDEMDDTINLTNGHITVSKTRSYSTDSDLSDLFAMISEAEGNQE